MATQAQIAANGANALHSTGAKTEAGKAASSSNHLSHGLTGAAFTLLAWEDGNAFSELSTRLELEHKPATVTEEILIRKMAQHYWLTQRAIFLQGTCFNSDIALGIAQGDAEKQLALYLRYQTTHDRAFHKSLNQLLKLRAEKRKAEIGFESQNHKQADHTRREANENRKQELHRYSVLLAEAKYEHQDLLNFMLRPSASPAVVGKNGPVTAEKAA